MSKIRTDSSSIMNIINEYTFPRARRGTGGMSWIFSVRIVAM